VTLYAAQGGNQLGVGAQVKYHGVVVGTVRKLDVAGNQAKLTLGLNPDYTHLIPKNVQARILPKTLIGQDYVDLVAPKNPSTTSISAGDVITRDRSETAVELETALNSLLTTLNEVPPEKLAVTLNAMAGALDGRGAELGRTLDTFEEYLSGLNPSVPTFVADLRAMVKTTRTYDKAAPELLDALNNFTTTARTLTAQRAGLDRLYRDVTGAADRTTSFLTANGDNLINLVADSRGTLGILAHYAPEYPCLLDQLAGLVPLVAEAFGDGTSQPALHATIQVTVARGKYKPNQDEPAYTDRRGPRCYPIMRLAPQYPDGGPIQDGSVAPANGAAGSGPIIAPTSARSVPNSPAESDLISGLFGTNGQAAPSFASLLLGPLLRGNEVEVR
jgi:virulence factor Mce-like protein